MLRCECFHVLQAWYETGQTSRRALKCPFKGKGQNFLSQQHISNVLYKLKSKWSVHFYTSESCWNFFVCLFVSEFPHYLQPNMWRNVSVNVSQSKMRDGNAMLLWSLSAPCRLEGMVQLCYKSNCKEIIAMQQLSEGKLRKWKQNSKGVWVRTRCTWSLFPFNITLFFSEPYHN